MSACGSARPGTAGEGPGSDCEALGGQPAATPGWARASPWESLVMFSPSKSVQLQYPQRVPGSLQCGLVERGEPYLLSWLNSLGGELRTK